MKPRPQTMQGLSCVALALAVCASARAQLKLVQTIPLPGVEGRIDHMAFDVRGSRLFVAALGNNTLEVIDVRAGKRVYTIRGLKEPQGVAYVPDLNLIAVANGQDGTCRVYDGRDYHVLHELRLGDDADNARYDAVTSQVVVGYGEGAIAWLDPATGREAGTARLAGHPESFQLERHGDRLFVNVPTAGQVAVVDRKGRAVTARWPLSAASQNFPMALDEEHHRLFVGCRKPARVLVYDTTSGKQVAALEIGGDTDDLFYDAAGRQLYASCGEGLVDVFRQDSPDRYTLRGRVATAPGARTSFFVPELKRLFVAVPHRGNQAACVRVFAAD